MRPDDSREKPALPTDIIGSGEEWLVVSIRPNLRIWSPSTTDGEVDRRPNRRSSAGFDCPDLSTKKIPAFCGALAGNLAEVGGNGDGPGLVVTNGQPEISDAAATMNYSPK